MKLAVIGAGPSGIICALHCQRSGIDVTLYEKSNQLAKKMLVAGGGMCNYTHNQSVDDFLKHYGENGLFLKNALRAFSPLKTIALFKKMGIGAHIREDGKIFPSSLSGKTMVDKLQNELIKSGVEIKLGIAVREIIQQDKWKVIADNESEYDAVVIATGGASYPHLGTVGDAYGWFKALNLPVVKPRPALTSIALNDDHSKVSGISFKNAELTIIREGKHLLKSSGELLITHKGLSGPLILNNSRSINSGDKIYINWLGLEGKSFDKQLILEVEKNGKKQLSTVLESFTIPKAFVMHQLSKIKEVQPDIKMSVLTKKQRLSIVEIFCYEQLNNPQCLGFKNAMVTAGGLSLDVVSRKTFAVKGFRGLYAVGEVIDIDGDTGGYNIQAALSMGYLASQHIVKQKVKN